MISEEKQSLRKEMRARLAEMSVEKRLRASERIRACIESLEAWRNAMQVLGFLPAGSEPIWLPEDIAGRTIAFPRMNDHVIEAVIALEGEEFATGKHGIREPAGIHLMEAPDLILVPGVAFDKKGGRLGRGRGHYDRFLAGKTVPKFGVCFACQLVGSVPVEPHDQRLDGVITEDGFIPVTAGLS